MTATRPTDPPAAEPVDAAPLRTILYWGIVTIPLAWGVYQTLVKSMALFR